MWRLYVPRSAQLHCMGTNAQTHLQVGIASESLNSPDKEVWLNLGTRFCFLSWRSMNLRLDPLHLDSGRLGAIASLCLIGT